MGGKRLVRHNNLTGLIVHKNGIGISSTRINTNNKIPVRRSLILNSFLSVVHVNPM